MLDRIGRLMDGVRQVSNAIAHDLRTPITRARARLEDAALHAAHARATCAPRSSAPRPTSTASSRCSRRCCASPRSRPASRRSAFAGVDLAPLLADVAELYGAVAEERGQVAWRLDIAAERCRPTATAT